jgi:plasmid stabilization system protein ParE
MKLAFTARSLSQAEHIDSWWRDNRNASPAAFSEDFAAVIAAILSMPRVMAPFDRDGVTVRRWLLKRTKHHVHYTVDESTQTVVILSVWGGPRGSLPPLL